MLNEAALGNSRLLLYYDKKGNNIKSNYMRKSIFIIFSVRKDTVISSVK